jgi:hypothetical protein
MTIQSRVSNWCEFGERRAYILMAIARHAHNEELTHNSEIVYRRVIQSKDEIERNVNDLLALIEQHDYVFRLYLTVNARDTTKGYFNFRDTLNQWSQDMINGDDHVNEKLGRVDSYWKSELHKPESKADSYFLFDLDNVEPYEVTRFTTDMPAKKARHVETPNGYHVISEPFNYTEWVPPVKWDDMDTDGQMFIAEVVNQSE